MSESDLEWRPPGRGNDEGVDLAREIDILRREVRDLAALFRAAAAWKSRRAEEIASDVPEVLGRLLFLDLASVRMQGAGAAREFTIPAGAGEHLREALARAREQPGGRVVSIAVPVGSMRMLRIGDPTQELEIVVGSVRPDFPTVFEAFLLRTTFEQANVAAKAARLIETVEEADRRKDEFLAMLGHELKNPLAAIVSGVELLKSHPDADRREWARVMIGRQVGQLQRLVNDLVDVSRITRGSIELRTDMVELNRALEEAVGAVREQIERRGHRLAVSFLPEQAFVYADAARLHQIVVNLLTNAAKYTDPGGLIELSAERGEGRVRIRFRDSGRGMTPQVLSTVFEPFTQADPSAEGSGSGLGVGLTLARRLAELHGGSLIARSDGPGKGSEFILELPLSAATVAHTEPRPGRAGAGTGTEPGGEAGTDSEPVSIVLIDDNRDFAASTRWLLEKMGHRVQEAHDGITGMDLARRECPDLLLIDVGLPDLDGREVARRLRAERCLEHARFVAISGHNPNENERGEGDFDDYLVKPVEPERLFSLLRGMSAPRSPASGLRESYRVLLIEDHPQVGTLTAELLRAKGQEVRLASSGREALETSREFRPEIVLCDLRLPDMNGREVARLLRERPETSAAFMVALTAHERSSLAPEPEQGGFDLVLEKPLVWERLREALSRRGGRS